MNKTSSGQLERTRKNADAVGRDLAEAIFACRAASVKKAEEIRCFDMRGRSDVVDYLVIATVRSRPQMRAVAEAIDRPLKAVGVRKLGLEGSVSSQWTLIDYGGCVIHLFSPDLRAYYHLEELCRDAKEVDWANTEAPNCDFPTPEGWNSAQ
jgi:ribosome-associated protein